MKWLFTSLCIGGGLCAACVSSLNMSDWIQCWQMAEKQRYGVNVSYPTPQPVLLPSHRRLVGG